MNHDTKIEFNVTLPFLLNSDQTRELELALNKAAIECLTSMSGRQLKAKPTAVAVKTGRKLDL